MNKCYFLLLIILLSGCSSLSVPHEEEWGVYSLNLDNKKTDLLYSSSEGLSILNVKDCMLAFEKGEEIYTYNLSSKRLSKLTSNNYLDTYPLFSPEGSRILYLSFNETLDVRVMNLNGSDDRLFYDSGFHDADISWVGDKIVFTRNSQVWIMNSDASNPHQLSNYSYAGLWGNANLPFGDYDPRLNSNASLVVFERLYNDSSPNGNYDIFLINTFTGEEVRLTSTGYSQGLASWSPDNNRLVYLLAAINDTGVFDIYLMNSDGSNNHNITPDYYPDNFLCFSPVFAEDNLIYFIGQWWE
ncbi:MAG: PD40 domain-containing protein [Nanoarchaeota archaeon]|nr:PD40 domain-containing protein [Nanoarchaeota archaeon]